MEKQNLLHCGAAIWFVNTTVAAVVWKQRQQVIVMRQKISGSRDELGISEDRHKEFTDQLWIKTFRMNQDTFYDLCDATELREWNVFTFYIFTWRQLFWHLGIYICICCLTAKFRSTIFWSERTQTSFLLILISSPNNMTILGNALYVKTSKDKTRWQKALSVCLVIY